MSGSKTEDTLKVGEAALGFGDAMAELEEILARIEGEEIDIDALAEELRRATELLELARGKIKKAEVEVTQIVQSLEGGDEGGDDEDAPGGDDEDAIPF
jgi:exodeoxyribonuclease VII small subunit